MSFLEQLEELRLKIPRLAIINVGQENAEYCTHADKNKNCYLLFTANYNEDCYYGSWVISCKDCMECSFVDHCELCYECLDCANCYNCSFSQDLRGCHDCEYCFDCSGCSDCFGCVGLRQKQFYVFNQPVSKEEYKRLVKEWKEKGERAILTGFEKLKCSVPRLYAHQNKNENCFGDYVFNSKNCYQCYDVHASEDCLYVTDALHTKDTVDSSYSDGSELCYECFSFGLSTYNCNFSSYIRTSSDLEYCELCFNCQNCFGCVGLQGKKFHILNQPYSKEEYFQKVAEIKAKMREDGSYGQHLPTTYRFEDTEAFA